MYATSWAATVDALTVVGVPSRAARQGSPVGRRLLTSPIGRRRFGYVANFVGIDHRWYMSWTLFKMATKGRNLPELAILVRIALALAGIVVLLPVFSGLRDPADLSVAEYVGLALFVVVAVWLFRAALRR